ncbi:MAG: emrA [Gammaproteobacteria bacterium]|jgi:membrane fusion protein (multidrug efflux system)|nr:emrA [Gammaproteobacteria bacterium]
MKQIIKTALLKIKASRNLQRVILLSLVGAFILGWAAYDMYSDRYISTDDAYVNANQVQIAPQVSGQVLNLDVSNNQFVKQGQLLFQIDPSQYQTAVAKAQAQLAIDQANLVDTQLTTNRTLALVRQKLFSQQQGDDAKAKLESAQAQVQLDQANLAQAKLNLGYTQVYASTDGWITNMNLRAGNIVTQDQAVFTLISSNQFWVDANYEETDLQSIKPGQTAKVLIDMYPKHPFKGVVDSISGGTGSAFSLLPPENATGNWVKVTQRVPVKILIVNPDPNYPLHIGTTASVTIDTGSK